MTVVQNDVIEAAARLEYGNGQDVVNVYDIKYNSAAPLAESVVATDILTMIEQIYTIILGIIELSTTFRDIRIRNKTTNTLMGTYAWPTLVAGTSVGEELPHGVCQMVSFPTVVPRVTMRKFLTRGTEAGLTPPGVWTAGALAYHASYGAYLIVQRTINGSLYQYGYLSPKTGTFVLPTSAVLQDVPAYQRRRKPGRGS